MEQIWHISVPVFRTDNFTQFATRFKKLFTLLKQISKKIKELLSAYIQLKGPEIFMNHKIPVIILKSGWEINFFLQKQDFLNFYKNTSCVINK